MDLRKLTKKGRQAAREEKERLERLNKTIQAIAVMRAEYNQRWEYCHARDLWESDWYQRASGIHERMERMLANRFIELGGKSYPFMIRGEGSISNYSLDERVRDQFGNEVHCFSEAGGLYIDTTEESADDVLKYLQDFDPDGEFHGDMYDSEEPINTVTLNLPFGRVADSVNEWLAMNRIEVKVDFSDAPGPSEKQLAQAQKWLERAVVLIKPELEKEKVEGLARGIWDFIEKANTEKKPAKKSLLRPRVNRD